MMAVKQIIEGQSPPLNRGATTGFMFKIIDEAAANESISDEIFNKLNKYALDHTNIVETNMARKSSIQPKETGINININQNDKKENNNREDQDIEPDIEQVTTA